jgi:hypothetical protein
MVATFAVCTRQVTIHTYNRFLDGKITNADMARAMMFLVPKKESSQYCIQGDNAKSSLSRDLAAGSKLPGIVYNGPGQRLSVKIGTLLGW